MEDVFLKLSDITKIRYKDDVTIFYTADKYYVCIPDTECYKDDIVIVSLASKRETDEK